MRLVTCAVSGSGDQDADIFGSVVLPTRALLCAWRPLAKE